MDTARFFRQHITAQISRGPRSGVVGARCVDHCHGAARSCACCPAAACAHACACAPLIIEFEGRSINMDHEVLNPRFEISPPAGLFRRGIGPLARQRRHAALAHGPDMGTSGSGSTCTWHMDPEPPGPRIRIQLPGAPRSHGQRGSGSSPATAGCACWGRPRGMG